MSAVHYQDVVLLQQALQNAGNDALKRRSLAQQNEQAMARLALEDEIRKIQQARAESVNNIEERRLSEEQRHNQWQEDQFGIRDAAAKAKDARDSLKDATSSMVQGLQGLSLDNSLSPEQKTGVLKQSIDGMDAETKNGILHNPQILALYNGQGDWGAVAAQVNQHRAQAQTEYLQLQDAYNKSTDPDERAGIAEMMKKVRSFAPKPNSTTTIDRNDKGEETKRTTTYGNPEGETGEPEETVPGENTPAIDTGFFGGQSYSKPNPKGVTLQPSDLDLTNNPNMAAPPQQQNQPAPAATNAQHNSVDVSWLQASPNATRIATFEKKYGQGSASQYLTNRAAATNQ